MVISDGGIMGVKSFSLCFTGISGSGKSTLAIELAGRLEARGVLLQVIDGDKLRDDLGNLFGYTREERMKNSRVVRLLSRYLNQNGINTIIAVVAPYEEMRNAFRAYLGDAYIQVYVKCPYETCAARDVKGYYKKQKAGQMEHLNGADDVFEEPEHNDIIVDTEHMTVDECVNQILEYLEEKNDAISIYNRG